METPRLRRIQEPSRIESLLQAYIARAHIVPGDSYQILDPRELPRCLRALITRAEEQGEVWSCWTRGSNNRLFTCHMPLFASRERGAPVLEVLQYTEDAELKESGMWRYDPMGDWSRWPD